MLEQGIVRGEQAFLGVQVKGAEKVGDQWRTQVLVRCRRRGDKPFPDCSLIVLRDTRDLVLGNIKTDRNGLFTTSVELPGSGQYFVSVMIKDTSIQAGDWVTIRPEKGEDPEIVEAKKSVELDKLALETVKLGKQLTELERTPTDEEKKLEQLKVTFQVAEAEKKVNEEDPEFVEARRNIELGRLAIEMVKLSEELTKLKREALGEPKVPFELQVSAEGARGRQVVWIAVFTEDKKPIPDCPFTLRDGSATRQLKTGALGDYLYPMLFDEESRSIAVFAGATKELQHKALLLGSVRPRAEV